MSQITMTPPREFIEHCEAHGLCPRVVLEAFMADLGETKDSNGSDERMLAAAWFDRVVWPEADHN